jgi:hypothetical protein
MNILKSILPVVTFLVACQTSGGDSQGSVLTVPGGQPSTAQSVAIPDTRAEDSSEPALPVGESPDPVVLAEAADASALVAADAAESTGKGDTEMHFDPNPVESRPAAEASSEAAGSVQDAFPSEVIPFAPGTDPFKTLAGPKVPDLPDTDPRTDTLRLAPKVPPEKGEVQVPFPPKVEVPPPVKVEVGELKVVRHVPEGEVNLQHAVTATLSQPMVPLASLADLEKMPVPLSLDPLPEGRFVWMGTDTVAFEPAYRLPFANRFTATVKAGVQSSIGGVLAKDYSWQFETPLPRVEGVSPHPGASEIVLDPEIRLTFNAAVDPAKVLAVVSLRSQAGGPVKLVPGDALVPEKTGNPLRDRELAIEAARTVVLKPATKLVPGTHYRLAVDKTLTCLEGPLPSGSTQEFGFATYFPLVVQRISCSWRDEPCYPGSPISLEFNNSLKKVKVDHLITVDPDPGDLQFIVGGRNVTILGSFKPSASYRVSVLPGFLDVHGQRNAKGLDGKVTYRPASPMLSLAKTGMAVLEKKFSPMMLLTSMNVESVKVRMVRVDDKDFVEVFERSNRWWGDKDDPMDGYTIAHKDDIKLGAVDNETRRTDIDLSPALNKSKSGTVYLEVSARLPGGFLRWNTYRQMALVQVTDLAITAALSDAEMVILVTGMNSGKLLSGATVSVLSRKGTVLASAQTDKEGLARLKSPAAMGTRGEPPYLLKATWKDDNVTLLLSGWGKGDYLSSYQYDGYLPPKHSTVGHVFTERGLYRPAEDVHVTAIIRRANFGPLGDLGPFPLKTRNCSCRVTDPRGHEIYNGDMTLTPFGTGTFSLVTEKNAPLGYYQVAVDCRGESVYGTFQLQEYRTPEYKSSVQWLEDGSNILVYRELSALIEGKYYFGAPMNGAVVSWTLRRTPSSYTPPGNQGFAFADVDPDDLTNPWSRWESGGHSSDEVFQNGEGVLDAQGAFSTNLKLDPGAIRRRPVSFTLEGEVIDKNRQSIAARGTILAHWAERCVGIRLDRSVVAEKESVEVSGVVTALNGVRHEGADVQIELFETVWETREDLSSEGEVSYSYGYKEVASGKCSFRSGKAPASCSLKVPRPGSYLVRATTLDKAGRPARAATWLYAYGEGRSNWSDSTRNVVDLVFDKTSYEPGETAKVLLQSPFRDAVGLVLVARDGIAAHYPVKVKNGTAMVEIPVQDLWLPAVSIRAALVRGRIQAPGESSDDRGRPMFAFGDKTLEVSKAKRTLQVQVTPSTAAVEPGATVDITVVTLAPSGDPVEANVALMVVDEGVLSLIAYATPDPMSVFYTQRGGGTLFEEVLQYVVPRIKPKPTFETPREEDKAAEMMDSRVAPAPMAMGRSAGGAKMAMMAVAEEPMEAQLASRDEGGLGGDDQDVPSFALREFFKSTAYFNGELRSGPDGRVTVSVPMPGNLTEFRVMAVVADNVHRFGSGDSQVQTRRPLLVRPSLPRFLNLGDTFEASAMVNNETGRNTDVTVRLLADNCEILETSKTISVRSGESGEVRFKARATGPGPATFQFAAVALTKERHTDAAQVTLPVLLPATAEAFATYGVVDTAIRQPLKPPSDAIPGFGGLDVSLSSTAMTGLQDAVKYLFDYPYECTEQICSRILPILALEEIIRDFQLGEAATPEEARKLVQAGIERLWMHQRDDGGFGSWSGSRESWLYVSAYAVMTLDWAVRRGYEVDSYRLERATAFLKSRLDHLHDWEEYAYGAQTMAVLVLARRNQPVPKHSDRLYKLATRKTDRVHGEYDVFDTYSRAWLLEALFREEKDSAKVKELLRRIRNAAVEKAGSIHFVEDTRESMKLMMHSDERSDAIVLGALLAVNPKDSMIDKVVRGLVRSQARGHWGSTQANAWVLLSLSEYYRIFESDPPNFTGGLWWGKTPLMGFQFKGRSMEIRKTRVPMADLLKGAADDLVLGKTGPGRLYYRLGLRYAPSDLFLSAEDRGFAVERTYLREGEDGELTRREDGTWVAKAGTYIRVKLRVVVPDRRYYVAVIDPMPAGVEAVNEAFVTSATSRVGTGQRDTYLTRPWWYWYWNPWDFEEKRDDRVQLFSDRMYGGVYEYTYVTRATALGEFVIPPARAEEMYEPETFGRSASERILIVE